MSKGKVVVLGVNGHIGRVVAEAFVAAGWDGERHGAARASTRCRACGSLRGDSDSVDDMRRAIGDTDLVVNALNLPYATWDKGRMEAQMARVLEAIGSSGKTMLFPGNIYNFNADQPGDDARTCRNTRRRRAAPSGCGSRRCSERRRCAATSR